MVISIPRSFKKLLAKNIFDQKLLKKYKKANKLNLKKKESLIALVSYFKFNITDLFTYKWKRTH